MTASYVVRGVHVLDRLGEFAGPVDIHVRGGVVAAVGSNLRADDASVDLSGLWLMPGVVDCHAHVAISTLVTLEALSTPVSRWAIAAARNAHVTLEAGVTLVRDAGGADAGIRDAIAAGLAEGPTLQLALVLLSQTGGHGDGYLQGIGLEIPPEYVVPDYPGRPPYLADGVDGVRHAVREILRAGADWIKVCATGGVLSAHDDPDWPEFTLEELSAAVFEAGRRGRGVFAHAMGGQGLDDAVCAGVRSIEHGVFLTEEQARGMAASGCWLVPTLSVMNVVARLAEGGDLPAYAAEKVPFLLARAGEALRIALDAGVPIALGTDALNVAMHGANLGEITLMVEAGMPLSAALLAATAGGAELCGLASSHGRLEPGYVFDAVVLGADPSDPRVFSDPATVREVFKNGREIRREVQLL